jgi:molybdopterin molybdotransferase
MATRLSNQQIARLTPLGDVLALVKTRVGPVMPHKCALAQAAGRILAEDIVVTERPAHAIALRDGFALAAASVVDASPYSPVPLASRPPRVDMGEPLPDGTDAVAQLDAVVHRGQAAEAIAPVAPGEGVLWAGGDASPRVPLRRAGKRLREVDVPVLAALGVSEVTIRSPRIVVGCGSVKRTPIIDAALDMLVRAVAGAGARAGDARGDADFFDQPHDDADAMIAVGGTGAGRNDEAVQALTRQGQVDVHGIAVSPGETAAFGFIKHVSVLLVPGRLDAALAVWLLIGRHLTARLAGGVVEDFSTMLPLKRKVTSAIGATELVPVACSAGTAEPLASGYLPLTALARSDGWIVVPPESEGFAAGTPVAVKQWPTLINMTNTNQSGPLSDAAR